MAPSILVVDDHLPTLHLIARMLAMDGHAVRTAADGDEALVAIARECPALVMTDILMPGMDGLALIAHLQQHYPQIRILALSAAGPAVALPGVQFLAKPFSHAELLAAVQAVLPSEASCDAHGRTGHELAPPSGPKPP